MLSSPFAGELAGTLVLILLGNGVVANVILKQTKGEGSGWIVIATGWAVAVIMGVFTANAFGSADAHINPAVSLAFGVLEGDLGKLPVYIPAQITGAFLGAVLVWIFYRPHFDVTADPATKLACFSTGPAIRSVSSNLASEVIGTVLLLVVIAAIGKAGSAPGAGPVPTGLGPYLVGMLVWGIGLSLGGTTGYAINPARDLGPRLAYTVLPISGKGDPDWAYGWIPVAGPLAGALIAAGVISLFL